MASCTKSDCARVSGALHPHCRPAHAKVSSVGSDRGVGCPVRSTLTSYERRSSHDPEWRFYHDPGSFFRLLFSHFCQIKTSSIKIRIAVKNNFNVVPFVPPQSFHHFMTQHFIVPEAYLSLLSSQGRQSAGTPRVSSVASHSAAAASSSSAARHGRPRVTRFRPTA